MYEKKNESRSYHQNSNLLCFVPTSKWQRAYSVTLFRDFVLPSFHHHKLSVHYLSSSCTHSTKFGLWMFHKNMHVNFKFGPGPMMFNRVKECINYYVEITQNTENTGQVKFKSDHIIFSGLCPLKLEKKRKQVFCANKCKTKCGMAACRTHLIFYESKVFSDL